MQRLTVQQQEVKVIVCETLTALGFDIRDPHEAQADMMYLRKMRLGSELMTGRMKIAIASAMLSTALWLIYQGIKSFLKADF